MKFSFRNIDFFLLIAAAAGFLALLYPGNTVWLGDEARLMELAISANAEGVVASQGLRGSVAVHYGALIVWMNQLLLLLTSDPVVIVAVKTALALAVSWTAIWRLAKCFHVPVGPGAALYFCSPFIWFYTRMPWDNVWLLPLSLVYIMFAAEYFKDGKLPAVIGAALALCALVYLHPLSCMVPVGFAVGIAVFKFEFLRRDWKKLGAVALGSLLLLSPYLFRCLRDYRSDPDAPRMLGDALLGALTAGRNLTGYGFTDRFAPEAGLTVMGTLLFASVPVIVFFMVLGMVAVIRRFRRREVVLFDRIVGVCGVTIVLNVVLVTALRLEHQVHYNSVMAFAFWLPAWRGFQVLAGDFRRAARALLAAALLIELGFLADFSRQVEAHAGGASEFFGTTLSRQWQVAKALTAAYRANPGLNVDLRLDRLKRDPKPFQVLIRLASEENLPPSKAYDQAVLLPSRSGSGIDLLLLEELPQEQQR